MNTPPPNSLDFTLEEPGRRIVFGAGAVRVALAAAGSGYLLLTTQRALATLPTADHGAAAVETVPIGRVDEIAGEMLMRLGAGSHPLIVALGGGRVIDTAKALAGAAVADAVVAIPTTLSAAEMTAFHRPAVGAPPGSRFVRPAIVGNDPALSASQPKADLAASTANSVAHAVAAATSPRATPVTAASARTALECLEAGWADEQPARTRLALGALLAGWSVGYSGLGLHHLLAQTVVREFGLAHGYGNLALLPVSLRWLAERDPEALAWIESGLDGTLAALADRLAEAAGVRGLAGLGVSETTIERAIDAAMARPDMAYLAPELTHEDVARLYGEAL
jgi:alcohol dehydrogenase class IV